MEWKISPGLTDYAEALEAMAVRVRAIQAGEAGELVWLVEHPPLYTLGTSAKKEDVLGHAIPAFETGRGGQVTYHGPGQRVVYLMLDLKKRAAANGKAPDLRAYVQDLERWIILTLAQFGVEGLVREGRVGVWVEEESRVESRESSGDAANAVAPSPAALLLRHHREAKIAALGVRVQKWVTSHGIAINVSPDLSHYAGIVPCGIREYGVTSLQHMGADVAMQQVDAALQQCFGEVFA